MRLLTIFAVGTMVAITILLLAGDASEELLLQQSNAAKQVALPAVTYLLMGFVACQLSISYF